MSVYLEAFLDEYQNISVSYTKDKAFILDRISEMLMKSKTGVSIQSSTQEKLYAIATWLFQEQDKTLKKSFETYLKALHSCLGNDIFEKLPSKYISFAYKCIEKKPI